MTGNQGEFGITSAPSCAGAGSTKRIGSALAVRFEHPEGLVEVAGNAGEQIGSVGVAELRGLIHGLARGVGGEGEALRSAVAKARSSFCSRGNSGKREAAAI